MGLVTTRVSNCTSHCENYAVEEITLRVEVWVGFGLSGNELQQRQACAVRVAVRDAVSGTVGDTVGHR